MEQINIKIRKATKDDCEEIMILVQMLADFQNMPNGVHLDAKTLANDGFGTSRPSFHCLVVDDPKNQDGKPIKLIAYALYNFIYGTWEGRRLWLEDIIVTEQYRRKGIGKKLFSAVCEEAVKENAKSVKFSVLKWNPAMKFYKQFGAIDITETEGWSVVTIKYDNVIKTANLLKE